MAQKPELRLKKGAMNGCLFGSINSRGGCRVRQKRWQKMCSEGVRSGRGEKAEAAGGVVRSIMCCVGWISAASVVTAAACAAGQAAVPQRRATFCSLRLLCRYGRSRRMENSDSRLCCRQHAHNCGASGSGLLKHSAALKTSPSVPSRPCIREQPGAAHERGSGLPILGEARAARAEVDGVFCLLKGLKYRGDGLPKR